MKKIFLIFVLCLGLYSQDIKAQNWIDTTVVTINGFWLDSIFVTHTPSFTNLNSTGVVDIYYNIYISDSIAYGGKYRDVLLKDIEISHSSFPCNDACEIILTPGYIAQKATEYLVHLFGDKVHE